LVVEEKREGGKARYVVKWGKKKDGFFSPSVGRSESLNLFDKS